MADLHTFITFIGGLTFLLAGAELLVRGASRIAITAGISPLVVGLTIVAFGTSSPELAVSVEAAWSGQKGLALANAVGSNLFNILVILGLSATVAPLIVHPQIVRQEAPVMIGLTVLLIVLAWDLRVSGTDGAVLATLMIGYTVFLIRQARATNTGDGVAAADSSNPGSSQSAGIGLSIGLIGMILGGLGLLVLGANWLVDASVSFARSWGISEVVIGLTVVAAGTSLPELATSVTAAFRGERDIAVGNVIGSNVFNIGSVVGISALVSPAGLTVPPSMFAFDLWFSLAVSVICWSMLFSGYTVSRKEGALLFVAYVLYTAYLITTSAGVG